MQEIVPSPRFRPWPSLVAAGLVVLGLVPVQLKLDPPVMVAERFWPGAGWGLIAVLSLYAAWLVARMRDPGRQPVWRRRVWTLFSVVFYLQLVIGLSGVEQFLMTGRLHFPIPALIAAGPAYRGGGWFMPILFTASVLLVGPAWCSHLCYQGAWDHAFARRRRRPAVLPGWVGVLRWISPVVIIGMALGLRALGASWVLAGGLALGFGLGGVAVMGLVSARTGVMVHCTAWCPMGAIASLLGKLNPFRIRMGAECDACGTCSRACRYQALGQADLERRRPGPSCTLCGDCVGSCRKSQMVYWFPGLGPEAARTAFIVVAVSLHAMFLGVAMI